MFFAGVFCWYVCVFFLLLCGLGGGGGFGGVDPPPPPNLRVSKEIVRNR